MDNEFLYDVFLSHSVKDKAVVQPLAERLRQDGLKVWFDEWMLKPGDSIASKIEAGLEHSRVLACPSEAPVRRRMRCMSANAYDSDWAQLLTHPQPSTFNHQPACDPLNKERRFIPLRFDDAPIKGSLAQFLYINWRPADREQEYAKLLAARRPAAKPPSLLSPLEPRQSEKFTSFWTWLAACDEVDALDHKSYKPYECACLVRFPYQSTLGGTSTYTSCHTHGYRQAFDN